MANIPNAVTYDGTRYLADGYQMRKQVGENFFRWGVPIPPAQGSAADTATGGDVVAGDYRLAIVAQNFLGNKSNPWKTNADFDYITVTVAADDSRITVTLPVHGDPQVEQMLVYRTLVGTESPYFYAGYVDNGTTSLVLNGSDASLPTNDYLEAPTSDVESLAGPFKYGRPPTKTICEVGMDDIIFVAGEEEYTDGLATAVDGSLYVTFEGATELNEDMEGKYFRVSDESVNYFIDSVQTSTRLKLSTKYNRPDWKETDPTGESFEIIGNANAVAPSSPGEPEYFSATEEFGVGRNEGGRIRAMRAYGNDMLVFTEDRVYRVSKGYTAGSFDVVTTLSNYGCISNRSAITWPGGCIFYSGEELCNYYNGKSAPITNKFGTILRTAVQDRKKNAISCIIGKKLYFGISMSDTKYIDTIFVYNLETGSLDQWDTFRIVDMNTVTVASGRQFLYIECPVADEGYALYAFTNAAYSDGTGAADYSGNIVTVGGRVITVDTTLPTIGLKITGLRLRIEYPDNTFEESWIESNTSGTITSATEFTGTVNSSCTYTVGAMELEMLSGKHSTPDPLIELDVKHTEISFGG